MTDTPATRRAHLAVDGSPLPRAERERRLSRMKVWHPRAVDLIGRFAFFERFVADALEGKHIAVPGRPGIGKSQLVKKLRTSVLDREARTLGYPIQGTAILAPWGDWRPILRVKTPPKVQIMSFAEAFLVALGDEDPTYGKEGEKTLRIKQKLGEQRTRILLIDEFQSLTDFRTDKFAYLAADWLKDLLNEEDASYVGYPGFVHAAFFGTQTMTPLFVGNGQLARRGVGLHPFKPYDWVVPAERALFGQTLDKLDAMMPFEERSLADERTRFRIHRATDAVISRIATLLQVAGFKAIDMGDKSISPKLMEESFDDLGWELGSSDFHPRANPWREQTTEPGFVNAPVVDTSRKTRVRGKPSGVQPDFRKAS